MPSSQVASQKCGVSGSLSNSQAFTGVTAPAGQGTVPL
eukprot:CAMPEP_0177479116 /NCGR_PEP_ID=MMETSP0369-20130122/25077_1 /TAXON_ID=447022 ORGANISM="Scrippsiella hangoei-like, Strain SHHI-4" /NCGR_SAMPLE_ID=MMETSP0369 /ASSEMBLY_ACC=CAM_ASM_000364 /LENGTH=37 /DNA_ID= /DNA_START= /DNA_END= /DNA_ORIENTATION=